MGTIIINNPVVSGDFRCMWNLGTGWGDFIKTEKKYTIVLADGTLIHVGFGRDGEHIYNYVDLIKKLILRGKFNI